MWLTKAAFVAVTVEEIRWRQKVYSKNIYRGYILHICTLHDLHVLTQLKATVDTTVRCRAQLLQESTESTIEFRILLEGSRVRKNKYQLDMQIPEAK